MSIWRDRITFLQHTWAHALVLSLHEPTRWPTPALNDLPADEKALADRMRAEHRGPDGELDPEFTRIAEALATATRNQLEWDRQHDIEAYA